MAIQSVKSIVDNCLGKTAPLSIKQDVLGVYATDNPQTRSLKARLDLIQDKPFVRVALVTIQGASPTLQRDLDNANIVYQNECDRWIYCQNSITVSSSNLLFLSQTDCRSLLHIVSNEEDQLFDLGRGLGADIVGYYINSSSGGFAGCAAHPSGRRGFWVGNGASPNTFPHELTHVVGDNPHEKNSNNLMFTPSGNITNLPPNLTNDQCNKIENDPDIEAC